MNLCRYTCNSSWSHCKFFLKLFKQSIFVKSTCTHVFSADTKHEMYFPLLIQVISRSCFRFLPAAPTIVHFVSYTCPDWPVISTYILHCLLSTIHTRSSIQSIHLSGLHPPPPSRLLQVSSLLEIIFQAVETLLPTSSAVSNSANWTLAQGL